MKTFIVLCVGALLFGASAVSARCHRGWQGPPPAADRYDRPYDAPKTESWYLDLGLGYSDIAHPRAVRQAIDGFKGTADVRHAPVNLDLGVYFPTDVRSAFGVSLAGIGDRYERGDAWAQVSHGTIGLTGMHFFGPAIGQGLYVRGDAGLAAATWETSAGDKAKSKVGWSVLVGGGYSFRILPGTRLMLGANYRHAKVKEDPTSANPVGLGPTSSVNFNLGLLF